MARGLSDLCNKIGSMVEGEEFVELRENLSQLGNLIQGMVMCILTMIMDTRLDLVTIGQMK